MAALLVSLALGCEHCERGLGRPLPKSCTGRDVHDIDYEAPFELRGQHAACLQPRLGWQSFDAVTAAVAPYVEHCVSHDGETRYIFTNGVPDHSIVVTKELRDTVCAVPWAISMPLAPEYDASYMEEVPARGPMAWALNGVSIASALFSVWNGFITETTSWNGHSNSAYFYWHYHNSRGVGARRYTEEHAPAPAYAGSDELVGFAADGFPIYGPLPAESPDTLDECNGRLVDGRYRYHMRRLEDVDLSEFDEDPSEDTPPKEREAEVRRPGLLMLVYALEHDRAWEDLAR